jgi:hypothetical protein
MRKSGDFIPNWFWFKSKKWGIVYQIIFKSTSEVGIYQYGSRFSESLNKII